MAKKTYLPTLVTILHRACVYIARYRAQMIAAAPEGFEAAVDALVTACEVVIALVDHPIGD